MIQQVSLFAYVPFLNTEFGDGIKTWNKRKIFGLVTVNKCFEWSVKCKVLGRHKTRNVVFGAFFRICYGPDTNIEIIVVNSKI